MLRKTALIWWTLCMGCTRPQLEDPGRIPSTGDTATSDTATTTETTEGTLPDTGTDSSIDTATTTTSLAADVELLDSLDWILYCSGIDEEVALTWQSADDQRAFVEASCSRMLAPAVDYDAWDVVVATVWLDCPFQGSPLVLEPVLAGGVLSPRVWTFPDHCFCDYYDRLYVLYRVPKGAYSAAPIDLLEEATCDQVTCSCSDGTETDGCDDGQFCPVTAGYAPSVDGLPPTP